ncbi:hypothetical protein PIB30_042300 [Stylosanthes scabra]|uniref:Uncharacterized protein n=1 Tax=Stylosanthes scabra TaxID=79078 RepID=A0ABU6XFI7_9FABA|nr:hypothetical protein [Stylosanthes scabra]
MRTLTVNKKPRGKQEQSQFISPLINPSKQQWQPKQASLNKNPKNRACSFHQQHWVVTHLCGTCDCTGEVCQRSEGLSSLGDGRDELSKPSSMEVSMPLTEIGTGANVSYDLKLQEIGSALSWVWRSILEGRRIVERGLHWQLGSGSNVKIFGDPWLPPPYPLTVNWSQSSQLSVDQIYWVKDLMLQSR